MRVDGRQHDELRPITITPHVNNTPRLGPYCYGRHAGVVLPQSRSGAGFSVIRKAGSRRVCDAAGTQRVVPEGSTGILAVGPKKSSVSSGVRCVLWSTLHNVRHRMVGLRRLASAMVVPVRRPLLAYVASTWRCNAWLGNRCYQGCRSGLRGGGKRGDAGVPSI
jgi:hypothetical protein